MNSTCEYSTSTDRDFIQCRFKESNFTHNKNDSLNNSPQHYSKDKENQIRQKKKVNYCLKECDNKKSTNKNDAAYNDKTFSFKRNTFNDLTYKPISIEYENISSSAVSSSSSIVILSFKQSQINNGMWIDETNSLIINKKRGLENKQKINRLFCNNKLSVESPNQFCIKTNNKNLNFKYNELIKLEQVNNNSNLLNKDSLNNFDFTRNKLTKKPTEFSKNYEKFKDYKSIESNKFQLKNAKLQFNCNRNHNNKDTINSKFAKKRLSVKDANENSSCACIIF